MIFKVTGQTEKLAMRLIVGYCEMDLFGGFSLP